MAQTVERKREFRLAALAGYAAARAGRHLTDNPFGEDRPGLQLTWVRAFVRGGGQILTARERVRLAVRRIWEGDGS